jgi:hypothetical protein
LPGGSRLDLLRDDEKAHVSEKVNRGTSMLEFVKTFQKQFLYLNLDPRITNLGTRRISAKGLEYSVPLAEGKRDNDAYGRDNKTVSGEQ